jgi:hypothetical protein
MMRVRTAALALCVAGVTTMVDAAPRLNAADVRIAIASPTSCEVTLTMTVDTVAAIDHRLEAPDGSGVELLEVRDATRVGTVQTIGRTQSLVLRPDGGGDRAYRIRYRAAPHVADRCPIWLPMAPADGRSRAVNLEVELPAGMAPIDSMPSFTWTGGRGTATIGHLPSVVRVSYAGDGDRRWGVNRIMDTLAIAVFVLASGGWTWRKIFLRR